MASVEKRYNKAGNLISFRIHVFHGRDEFGKQLPPFIKTVRVPPELNARQIETLIQRETVHFEEECELITAHEKEEAAKAAEPKCISFEDFAVKVMEIKERTGKEKSTLKEISEILGKETIDSFNTSETRGRELSHGMNYQKLGKELMTQDEIAVMDGGKCILQVRGVRPFFSDKFDITRHPKYKYLSDADPKNAFDVERFIRRRMKVKADTVTDVYEVDAEENGDELSLE